MTVKELKLIIGQFDDDTEVIVFNQETGSLDDVTTVCVNGNAIQMNVGEKNGD